MFIKLFRLCFTKVPKFFNTVLIKNAIKKISRYISILKLKKIKIKKEIFLLLYILLFLLIKVFSLKCFVKSMF